MMVNGQFLIFSEQQIKGKAMTGTLSPRSGPEVVMCLAKVTRGLSAVELKGELNVLDFWNHHFCHEMEHLSNFKHHKA